MIFSVTILSAQKGRESDSREIIQNYLEENQEKLELADGDIEDWIIVKEYFSKSTKATHVYIKQRHEGIVITDGDANSILWMALFLVWEIG